MKNLGEKCAEKKHLEKTGLAGGGRGEDRKKVRKGPVCGFGGSKTALFEKLPCIIEFAERRGG